MGFNQWFAGVPCMGMRGKERGDERREGDNRVIVVTTMIVGGTRAGRREKGRAEEVLVCTPCCLSWHMPLGVTSQHHAHADGSGSGGSCEQDNPKDEVDVVTIIKTPPSPSNR
jgi:hypothetical protein